MCPTHRFEYVTGFECSEDASMTTISGAIRFSAPFGLAPETAPSLSQIKHVRELFLRLPGLLFLQVGNGIDLLRGLCGEATPAAVTVENE